MRARIGNKYPVHSRDRKQAIPLLTAAVLVTELQVTDGPALVARHSEGSPSLAFIHLTFCGMKCGAMRDFCEIECAYDQ
jgi:hypothetical protein